MSKIIKSVIFMFSVTFVFTSLVTGVKLVNQDRIKRNQDVKFQRTILEVLGFNSENLLKPERITETYDERIEPKRLGNRTIYACYADDGKTVSGYAFPVGGPGFWGPVYAMAAVDSELTKLLGVSFYRHSETPGLGGRISEKWFSDQFKGLNLEPDGSSNQYFYLTPGGDKKRDNDLDAITGASGTSDAVESFLNRELRAVVEELKK